MVWIASGASDPDPGSNPGASASSLPLGHGVVEILVCETFDQVESRCPSLFDAPAVQKRNTERP